MRRSLAKFLRAHLWVSFGLLKRQTRRRVWSTRARRERSWTGRGRDGSCHLSFKDAMANGWCLKKKTNVPCLRILVAGESIHTATIPNCVDGHLLMPKGFVHHAELSKAFLSQEFTHIRHSTETKLLWQYRRVCNSHGSPHRLQYRTKTKINVLHVELYI